MFGSAKKREVLSLIGERAAEGKRTSVRSLAFGLLISSDAARSHLTRLWRERLIRSSEEPSDYVSAMRLGCSIREVEFRITRRGLERLERWKELEEQKGWLS